jgi:hypothetical protein
MGTFIREVTFPVLSDLVILILLKRVPKRMTYFLIEEK